MISWKWEHGGGGSCSKLSATEIGVRMETGFRREEREVETCSLLCWFPWPQQPVFSQEMSGGIEDGVKS